MSVRSNLSRNIAQSFLKTLEKDSKFNVLGHKVNNKWVNTNRQELNNMISNGIQTLKDHGVGNGDRVAYKGNNSAEWVAWNMSCYAVGGVWVPMYYNQSSAYCNHVIHDCEPKVLVTDMNVKHQMTSNDNIYNTNTQFVHNALDNSPAPDMTIEKNNDIAALIYTSGTTGSPKGVVLSHENILTNMDSINERFNEIKNFESLNILPWAHIYSLTCEMYYNLLFDNKTNIASGIDNFITEANEVKPNSLYIVPKVLETIKRRVDFMDKPVIRKVLPYVIGNLFGNNLEVVFVGGAKLDRFTKQFYLDNGINICEGYGCSETAPMISVNHHIEPRNTQSIGKILKDVEVEIMDGEICVAGPNVMRGYWNDEEATNKAFVNKDDKWWYKTGDSGKVEDGFLFFDGRISENYKLSNGKFVSVSRVENNIRKYLKSNFVIYGENRDHNTLITDEEVSKEKLALINEDLNSYMKIKHVVVVSKDKMEEFLTPKLSIKRKPLIEYVKTFDLMK